MYIIKDEPRMIEERSKCIEFPQDPILMVPAPGVACCHKHGNVEIPLRPTEIPPEIQSAPTGPLQAFENVKFDRCIYRASQEKRFQSIQNYDF